MRRVNGKRLSSTWRFYIGCIGEEKKEREREKKRERERERKGEGQGRQRARTASGRNRESKKKKKMEERNEKEEDEEEEKEDERKKKRHCSEGSLRNLHRLRCVGDRLRTRYMAASQKKKTFFELWLSLLSDCTKKNNGWHHTAAASAACVCVCVCVGGWACPLSILVTGLHI